MKTKEKRGEYTMKDVNIERFVKERIKENEELFTKKEHSVIKRHMYLVKKIYILGVNDGRATYKNK